MSSNPSDFADVLAFKRRQAQQRAEQFEDVRAFEERTQRAQSLVERLAEIESAFQNTGLGRAMSPLQDLLGESELSKAARGAESKLDPSTTGGQIGLDVVRGITASGAGRFMLNQSGATQPQLSDLVTGGEGITPESLLALQAEEDLHPIPFFPDPSTIAGVGTDIAATAPLVVGGSGAIASRLPLVTKGEIAVVRGLLEGLGFSAIEAGAGSPTAHVGLAGAAGAAGRLVPVATKASAQAIHREIAPAIQRVRQEFTRKGLRFQEGERIFAEFIDTTMGKFGATQNKNIPPEARAQLIAKINEAAPGLGDRILDIQQRLPVRRFLTGEGPTRKLAEKQLTLADAIPELRGMGRAWDKAVKENLPTRAAKLFGEGGGAAAAFWEGGRGAGRSIVRSLNDLGPWGREASRRVEGLHRRRNALEGEMLLTVKDILRRGSNVTDDELIEVINMRETLGASSFATPAAIQKMRAGLRPELRGLFDLLDDQVPKFMGGAGLMFEGFTPGRYFSHIWDTRLLNKWVRKKANRVALARMMSVPEDKAHEAAHRLIHLGRKGTGDALTDLVDHGKVASNQELLRTSIDYSRKLPITYRQALVELKMPINGPRESIAKYISQVSERVSAAEQFGPRNEAFKEILEGIGKDAGLTVADQAKTALAYAVGITPPEGVFARGMSPFMGTVVVPATLALAQLANATQTIVNVPMKTGIRRLASAHRKAFMQEWGRILKTSRDSPRDVLMKFELHAALTNGAMQDVLTGVPGLRGSGMRRVASNFGRHFLDKTGFNAIERHNRLTSSIAGMTWADDMVKKALRREARGLPRKLRPKIVREFKKLGLDFEEIVKKGGMSEDDMFEAGLGMSDLTQFRVRPGDMPIFWSSANAAPIRMLKTFAFNQSRFLWENMAEPALKRGDFSPLAYYYAFGLPTGSAVLVTRRAIKGEEIHPKDESTLEFLINAHAYIGGFGYFSDVVGATSRGLGPSLEFAAGPALTKSLELVFGGVEAAREGDYRAVADATTQLIPFVSQNVGGLREPVSGRVEEFLANVGEPVFAPLRQANEDVRR